MKESKEVKHNELLQMVKDAGHYVVEKPNGQIMVAHVSFWTTKEKWYDGKNNTGGVGIKSFLEYLDSL